MGWGRTELTFPMGRINGDNDLGIVHLLKILLGNLRVDNRGVGYERVMTG